MIRTRLRVIIGMLICLVLGIAILWTSTSAPTPLNAVLSAVGTVVITVGAVNLVSDFFLKKSISDDLIELVNSDRSLATAGIDRITEFNKFDWDALIGASRRLTIAVVDLDRFRASIWPRVLAAAEHPGKSYQVLLPDRLNIDLAKDAASRTDSDIVTYQTALEKLESDLQKDWQQAQDKPKLKSKSRLEIRRCAQIIRYQFILADTHAAVILEPLSATTRHIEVQVFRFSLNKGGQPVAAWLADSIEIAARKASAPINNPGPPPSDGQF